MNIVKTMCPLFKMFMIAITCIISLVIASCNRKNPPTDDVIIKMLLPEQVSQDVMRRLASEGRYPFEWNYTPVKIQRGKVQKSDGSHAPKETLIFPIRFTYFYNDLEILMGPQGRYETILRSKRVLERQFWRNEFDEWMTNEIVDHRSDRRAFSESVEVEKRLKDEQKALDDKIAAARKAQNRN